MALVATDWTITRGVANDIRYVGGDHDGTGGTPSYATVIEFHRWLQGLADDAVAAGDDELDITSLNPSARSTDNIITLINNYNIDATAAEHLYDGSIIQNDGEDIYDGIVNFGNADVQIRIIQNGAVISSANSFWNYNNAGLNADATSGISHRFMIQTRSGGTDIDGRKLIGTCRRFGYTYSEFTINATARGNNVLALTDSTDLNNQTDSGTVSGWSTDYTNTEGYAALDIDNNLEDEHYYSDWNISGTHTTINDFYEYTKYLSRDGSSATTLYGISGELFRGITHDITVVQSTGTFVEPELLTWGAGATLGTGQLFAANSTTSATHLYIQLLTGAAPNGSITGATGVASVTSYLERTVSKPFCGASTGSAIIGAYGLGIEPTDLSSSDSLSDLEGDAPKSPPNYVTNTLAGLVDGEDRVLVAPRFGVDSNNDPAINKTQMTLSTALAADNITSVVVNAVPDYTPASGTIRVIDNDGFERRLIYTAVNTTSKTFTIDPAASEADVPNVADFLTVNASISNGVYISYIDDLAGAPGSLSFTSVHSDVTALSLVIIVRDGGEVNNTPIKQYIAPWSQTNSNNTATAIRTSDT